MHLPGRRAAARPYRYALGTDPFRNPHSAIRISNQWGRHGFSGGGPPVRGRAGARPYRYALDADPFRNPHSAIRISNQLILRLKQQQIVFPRRPLLMGIVNLNADSFSGDGTLDVDEAIRRARALIQEGADIIDVGGESARTNRPAISEQQEIDRVAPFIPRFRECYRDVSAIDHYQVFPPLLSLNTWRSPVADTLLSLGGDLLNDMSALATDENARIAANHRAALLIMHSIGLPKEKHTHVRYPDIMDTLERFFAEKIDRAERAGLDRENVLLDPGLDFAKQREDNLRILRQLDRLTQFERPILLAVSRKTVIGEVLQLADPKERDAGSIACTIAGMCGKASIFRVHNVRAASLAVRTAWKVIGEQSAK